MKAFFRNNSLSIVIIFIFLFTWAGQFITGYKYYNQQRSEEGQPSVSIMAYSRSGHFIEATFENWESEFLQMALYVVLTIFLRQKGSAESKKITGKEEVDRAPSQHKIDAPWPVKKGGMWLKIYSHSLSFALFLLFIISFVLHFYGSLKDENAELLRKGLPPETVKSFMSGSRFWFESFQNWQSEFLSILTLVIFTIFLRQKGSPQSKPVDTANLETSG